MLVHWIGDKPSDADEWEQIITKRSAEAIGTGSVKLRDVGTGWWIEGARVGHVAVGTSAGPVPVIPHIPPLLDYRWHLAEALRKAGKPVIGPSRLGEPLTPETEGAIRAALQGLGNLDPQKEASFDRHPVEDLLAELDRLRGQLLLFQAPNAKSQD